MAAPSTVEHLVDLVAKSRLLNADCLDDYLRHQGATAFVPESSGELADLLVRDNLLTRFQADNLLQGKWHRFFVGPYKVLQPLGAGSAAVVYLCEHAHMRRRVAVKVLQGEKARDPKSLERFYREARAAAALDHPNIVKAFDVGQEDRFHYLVMEYVDGESLLQAVKAKGPLSAARAADYLHQAALGLQHAHEAGLVHRDIRPGNLMIDRAGVVKVLDLGLARFFEEDGDVLTQGAVLGHADYIAPEQATDSHTVDIRADIYSLGQAFLYALTGNRPGRAGLDALKRPDKKRSAGSLSSVPEGLLQVLRKMTHTDPQQRYQTPEEVAAAVAPWAPEEAERLLLVDEPPAEPVAAEESLEVFAVLPPPAAPIAPSAQTWEEPAQPSDSVDEDESESPWADDVRGQRTLWVLLAAAAVLIGLLASVCWPR